ncbi:MAG: hypothetical protein DRI01_00710 [Chloroflexi bacterium]|nr:MAG: hypothetical protein DRI01_00710 [Chloroflexota bacterium]
MGDKIYKIKGREFYLSPLTPAVEKNIYRLILNILNKLSDEEVEKIKQKKINQSLFHLLDTIGALSVENISKFIACIICPVGQTEEDKNLDELTHFLEYNLPLGTQIRILNDFFTQEDIILFIASVKQQIKRLKENMLQTEKQ